MHNISYTPIAPRRRLLNRRGSTAIAVLLLSLGVGASTAAFTLLNGVMPHSAPFVTCETTIEYTGDQSGMPARLASLTVPPTAELQDRLSDAYQTSYEAADDAVSSWSDAAGQVGELGDVADASDVGGRILAVLIGAGALALLVACTRGAARALTASRSSVLFAVVALGALPVAALLASALGLPALGVRAIAFMLTVSVVAAYAARAGRVVTVPAATPS